MIIDAQLARRLVDSQFPEWKHLAITGVDLDGWDNRTFRLGAEMTVRLPSGPQYALQVEKEQRWLPTLAGGLPLPIPAPIALGAPGHGYPYPWSVYRWIDGQIAAPESIGDLPTFAADLAHFLTALQHIDAHGRPVIDFGSSGVGDPACDLVIAWTLFTGGSRTVFRDLMALDHATWARARGWALWKSLITLAGVDGNSPAAALPRRVITELLAAS